MSRIQTLWTEHFSDCPFKEQIIRSSKQIEKISLQKLIFNELLFSSQKDLKVKYSFVPFTRGKSGVFLIKEADSKKIITTGSSSLDMYDQIVLHIGRYQIDVNNSLLSVLLSPARLVKDVATHIKNEYLNNLIDPVYNEIIPFYNNGEIIPVEKIKFFDFFDYAPKSIRHTSRVKTNIIYLRNRPGIYFINECEKGDYSNHKIVYIGAATKDLYDRIYCHFLRSRVESTNVNYFEKLETHDYQVGVIEVPRPKVSDGYFTKSVLALEKYLIRQVDPRDNTLGKIKKEIIEMETIPLDQFSDLQSLLPHQNPF